jgi:uncharacterized coiled-coil protein SlyX
MGKKISEMTLEELQDYALNQDKTIQGLNGQIADKDKQIADLNTNNQVLIKRNNDLFLKVEQQTTGENKKEENNEDKPQSCEDFAKNLVLGGK